MLLMSCYHVCNAGFTISCQCVVYHCTPISNLGSMLLCSTNDDDFFLKGYICHINSYFGKGKIYLLFIEFRKCVRICVKTY